MKTYKEFVNESVKDTDENVINYILDKINKYGIETITKNDKKY